MHRFIIGLLVLLFLHLPALTVRADRLQATWIGPNGLGGEGNWNTPSNWNLGVVPNAGTDGDGDGLPDIFDVRIDALPASASLVHNIDAELEVTGLTIDRGDTVNLTQPFFFTLRDPNRAVEVVNDGRLIVGESEIGSTLAYAGDSMRLRGNGTLELGIERGEGSLTTLAIGGRLINGPGHTILTSGTFHRGRILDVALTNEGTISAENSGNLLLRMYGDADFNFGTIRAATRGFTTLVSRGTLHNHGLVAATDEYSRLQTGSVRFVNESDGVVSASNGGTMWLVPPKEGNAIVNAGLIEATDHGVVQIERQNIVRQGQGIIQAKGGGLISLRNGTFHPDPFMQIVDAVSTLEIGQGAVFENQGNVLSAGIGTLLLTSCVIRGGELTSGDGAIILWHPRLENITLSGSAISQLGVQLTGTINFNSDFTVAAPNPDSVGISISMGDAVLQGPGVSKFGVTDIYSTNYTLINAAGHQSEFDDLSIRGKVVNEGVILTSSARIYGGVLSGTGVLVSSSLGVFDGSTLAPGSGIGTMPVSGRVRFGFQSTFLAELGATDSDLLDITGDLIVDGFQGAGTHLVLSGGLIGRSYVIAKYTGEREGTFDNVTPGYNVIYDDAAKQIRVEVIPEPASAILALIGLASCFTVALRHKWLKNRA